MLPVWQSGPKMSHCCDGLTDGSINGGYFAGSVGHGPEVKSMPVAFVVAVRLADVVTMLEKALGLLGLAVLVPLSA